MYTSLVKNITISVDDELWSRVREAAAEDRISMNAFIRAVLTRTVRRNMASTGERLADLAEAVGPAPRTWRWSRTQVYEDAV